MAQSIMDYIARRIALDYLDFDTRSSMGIYTASERQRQLETGSYTPVEGEDDEEDLQSLAQSASSHKPKAPAGRSGGSGEASDGAESAAVASRPVPAEVHSSAELVEAIQGRTATDAPMCFTCGTKMRPAGSCYVCEGCGSTSGCS
jgi:ribonucleoside-diphosphate reductase alpha chain